MIRTYKQPLQWTIIFILILSGVACSQLLIMGRTISWYYLLLAFIPLLMFIACARPLLENRSITIGKGRIIIHDRFCKPLEMKIAGDLYQIVMKDDKVRSFRFQSKNKCIQFCPMAYHNGSELAEAILKQIKQEGTVVEIVSA